MIEEIDRILLETLFGEEGRYGISYPDDDESVFPDGTASVFCTNWAGYVLRVLGERCSLHGFSVDDNPGSAIAVSSGGHDFALVDGRWIVDGWVKNVECMADHSVFDLEDPAEAAEIASLYGRRDLWKPLESFQSAIEKEQTAARERAMAGTDFGPAPAMLP